MVKKFQRIWIIFIGLFIALVAAFAVPKTPEKEVCAWYPPFDHTIRSADDLKLFRNYVNNGNNLEGATVTLYVDITLDSTEWTGGDGTTGCIGYDSGHPFKGTFNGNGHTISGLTIDRSGYPCEGLFGYNSGTIKNLTLADPNINCYNETGGICGINTGTVENCHVTTSANSTGKYIQGNNHVGGICGQNSGTITKCTNSALIRSTGGGVAGIAGECISGSKITYCTNTATVKTTCGGDVYAGGIAGVLSSGNQIGYCINRGEVYPTDNFNYTTYNSNDSVGGITGGFYSGHTNISVRSCANYGRIRGGNGTGGIVGWDAGSNSSAVVACFNSSEVLCSETNSGQIIGSGGGITPNRCYYNSSVSATGATGTGKPGTAATSSQFASGEMAYRLGSSSYGWYQSIDNGLSPHDDFPVLDSSHGEVYLGYWCKSSTLSYSNYQLNSSPNVDHPGYNNGFCTKCGKYQACSGSGTSESPYLIDNAGKLYWFSAVVNNNLDKCAVSPGSRNVSACGK
ncbi:MAG: hypothetical protein IJJ04_03885, partial [Clostridia bacterium]|nr:hypothetical protein [Clostridia bacterium]